MKALRPGLPLGFARVLGQDQAHGRDDCLARIGLHKAKPGLYQVVLLINGAQSRHDEGTGQLVGTCHDVLLGGLHAVQAQGLHGVVNHIQGHIADGAGGGSNLGQDAAGGIQLLGIGTLVSHIQQLFEGAAGAGTGLTAQDHDGLVSAAQINPVGDLAGVDVGQLLGSQVGNGVGGVGDHGDTVNGHNVLHSAAFLLAVLQGTGSIADVGLAANQGFQTGAGAGVFRGNGDVGIAFFKALDHGLAQLLHGSGAGQSDGAGELGSLGSGLGGLSGGSGGSCGSGGGFGALCTAGSHGQGQYACQGDCNPFFHFCPPKIFLCLDFGLREVS